MSSGTGGLGVVGVAPPAHPSLSYFDIEPLDEADPTKSDFYVEALTMARLHHPNILRLIGFCLQPPALVSELW